MDGRGAIEVGSVLLCCLAMFQFWIIRSFDKHGLVVAFCVCVSLLFFLFVCVDRCFWLVIRRCFVVCVVQSDVELSDVYSSSLTLPFHITNMENN